MKYLLGALGGALLGYLYYRFIGCNGGSCPITSSSVSSIAYGVLMGLVMVWK